MHTSLCTEILVAASEASSDIFQTGSLWSHSQCPVGSQMPGQKVLDVFGWYVQMYVLVFESRFHVSWWSHGVK